MSIKSISSHITNKPKATPQSEPVPVKNQVQNNAGGYVFQVNEFTRLDRFLILGSEGGTYYATERSLTQANAKNVIACVKKDGIAAVDRIVEISDSGRAAKNDPALLALALAATYGDDATKRYAMQSLPKVARTGTHLFHFAHFANELRGWGRVLKQGIQDWYQDMDLGELALQIVKYQQRDGWSHRDLLRLAHPKTEDQNRNTLYRYIVKGAEGIKEAAFLPNVIVGAEKIKGVKNAKEAVKLIEEYRLPREVIPTELLNSVEVWEALLQKMPVTAMIRNLGKMTSIGLLKPLSDNTKKVVETLKNEVVLQKARVHPLNVLTAHTTYASGHGMKGSLAWNPVPQIISALNEAFYLSFKSLVPANKKTFLGLDVSASMGGGRVAGSPLTPIMAEAAMAMVTMRSEPEWYAGGFATQFRHLPGLTSSMDLQSAMKYILSIPMGGTDCAQPMIFAAQNKIEVDTFVIYTDNETWYGTIHPFQALKNYRQKMGRDARLAVTAFTGTEFTIADPSDAGMLDVVGFDSAAPSIISSFSAREF